MYPIPNSLKEFFLACLRYKKKKENFNMKENFFLNLFILFRKFILILLRLGLTFFKLGFVRLYSIIKTEAIF